MNVKAYYMAWEGQRAGKSRIIDRMLRVPWKVNESKGFYSSVPYSQLISSPFRNSELNLVGNCTCEMLSSTSKLYKTAWKNSHAI